MFFAEKQSKEIYYSIRYEFLSSIFQVGEYSMNSKEKKIDAKKIREEVIKLTLRQYPGKT